MVTRTQPLDVLYLVHFVILALVSAGVGLNSRGIELDEHLILRLGLHLPQATDDGWRLLFQHVHLRRVKGLEKHLLTVSINGVNRLNNCLHTTEADALQILKLLLKFLNRMPNIITSLHIECIQIGSIRTSVVAVEEVQLLR